MLTKYKSTFFIGCFMLQEASSLQAAQMSTDAYSVKKADYDNDGLKDIVLVPNKRFFILHGDEGEIDIPLDITEKPLVLKLYGDGTYSTIYPANSTVISSLNLVATDFTLIGGDFNGDGSQDLLFQAASNGQQTFIVYSDQINKPPKLISYLGAYDISKANASIQAVDVQGDGYKDIVCTLIDGTFKIGYGSPYGINETDIQYSESGDGGQCN